MTDQPVRATTCLRWSEAGHPDNRALRTGDAMTVVVGYVPTETGFLAVTAAEREARAIDAPVVIVNVVGYSGYTVPTAADERDLDAVGAYLTAHGVRNSLRHFDEVESEAVSYTHL